MHHRGLLVVAAVFGLAASCGAAEQAVAEIRGTQPNSPISGTASFSPAEAGLRITIDITGAPAGSHGIHIHENGSCADGGNAAGGHYNPAGVQHGFVLRDGMGAAHAGDLGNIEIAKNGTGHLELTVSGLSLGGVGHDVVGRAVILHEKVDDFGQPTGNAGSRIACGVITLGELPASN